MFFKGKDKKLILNSSNDMCDNDLLDASNIRIYNDGHRFFHSYRKTFEKTKGAIKNEQVRGSGPGWL